MSRSTRFAIGIAITATVVSACGGGADEGDGAAAQPSSSDEPIVIGASVSRTGAYASSGTNVANGYELAVKQINDNGGVLGRQLELRLEDDQSDAGIVGRIYTEFLGAGDIDAVLSPYGSALGGPAAQLAERYETPMAHSQTSSPAVFDGTKWSVMAGLGPGRDVLAQVPEFAVEAGYEKITLVHNDLDAFKGICDGVENAIADAGATLVDRIEYAASTTDFSSTALKVAEGSPEVVGELAEKVVGYTQFSEALGYEGTEDFVSGYDEEFGTTVNAQAAGAYATVQVLAAAIEEAGSTDKAEVNTALHEGSFDTVIGTYEVDENGVQTGYSPVLFQWLQDEQAIVYPADSPGAVDAQLPY
jgi:branched-chain amino acid transport system substrate-binding protein